MVVANRPHWGRRAFRIAGWIALAVIYAIAFHYAKKYEAEMLTDAPPSVRATYAAAERMSQPENLGHEPRKAAQAGAVTPTNA
jgi:hypothetical protein